MRHKNLIAVLIVVALLTGFSLATYGQGGSAQKGQTTTNKTAIATKPVIRIATNPRPGQGSGS